MLYWDSSQKGSLKVMIAACDTFRAGAVEQLRTHSRNLDVYLFDQGYGKDASVIARNALKYATHEGYNVVLIDTAGRMQDNEPLMKALAKLVSVNNPDLVLFVGEALVGNDAIDQLVKFNRSLIDYAPSNVRCWDKRTSYWDKRTSYLDHEAKVDYHSNNCVPQ